MNDYLKKAKETLEDENLSPGEKRNKMDELNEWRNKLSSKSSSSASNAEALKTYEHYLGKYDKVAKSDLTELEKRKKNLEIMEEENKKINYKKKITDIDRAGHNRNYKSVDETVTKPYIKGIPRDTTAPNLGGDERLEQFEEKARQPMGLGQSGGNLERKTR